eukprot:309775_1
MKRSKHMMSRRALIEKIRWQITGVFCSEILGHTLSSNESDPIRFDIERNHHTKELTENKQTKHYLKSFLDKYRFLYNIVKKIGNIYTGEPSPDEKPNTEPKNANNSTDTSSTISEFDDASPSQDVVDMVKYNKIRKYEEYHDPAFSKHDENPEYNENNIVEESANKENGELDNDEIRSRSR